MRATMGQSRVRRLVGAAALALALGTGALGSAGATPPVVPHFTDGDLGGGAVPNARRVATTVSAVRHAGTRSHLHGRIGFLAE